jgi:catechol 2,3-dioxygenase-like lactoylglutathione lyase family enzyme
MISTSLNVVTLGVTDLDRQRAFYRALGWEVAIEAEDFCAFRLDGLYLGLFPWDKLAADGQTRPAPRIEGMRGAVSASTSSDPKRSTS